MAEYNFKRLTDVEALPEVPEGANALVEVNGEVKRVPGDGLGGGAVLGEDGKLLSAVLPDGYPRKELLHNLCWDGNIEGVDNFTVEGSVFYKISDDVLTSEQLIGSTVFVSGVNENEIFAEAGLSNTFSIESSMVQSSEDGAACMVIQANTVPNIISSSTVDLNGVTLPSIGTYVLYVAEGTTLGNITFTSPVFVSRLTKSTTHPITEEFLPAGAGIKTAIIKDSNYDNALAGVQTAETEVATTYECINMTFEEAYETMMKGEPLAAHIMRTVNSNLATMIAFMVVFDTSINSLVLITEGVELYWTADGLSTEAPASA